MAKKPATPKTVDAFRHEADKRRNIPTAEFQSVMQKEAESPIRVAYERRNRDLDPSDLRVMSGPWSIRKPLKNKTLWRICSANFVLDCTGLQGIAYKVYPMYQY